MNISSSSSSVSAKNLWIALAIASWVVWALFLSDHSVARLLQLQAKEKGLARRAALLDQEIESAKRELPGENPSLEEAELLLRGRHFYARKGEMIYVY